MRKTSLTESMTAFERLSIKFYSYCKITLK